MKNPCTARRYRMVKSKLKTSPILNKIILPTTGVMASTTKPQKIIIHQNFLSQKSNAQ